MTREQVAKLCADVDEETDIEGRHAEEDQALLAIIAAFCPQWVCKAVNEMVEKGDEMGRWYA